MTETAVIVILVLLGIMCPFLYYMLHIICKKLISIQEVLMGLESRQRTFVFNQEIMDTKIDFMSSLLEDFEEILDNENKEKEKG